MARRLARARSTILMLGVSVVLASCASAGSSPAAPGDGAGNAGGGRYGTGTGATDSPSSTDGDAAGAGGCRATSDPGQVAVTMDGRAFSTTRVAAHVGDIITFTNRDPVPHTATLDDGSCTTDSLGKGASGGLTFAVAGTYPFHCRIHPDMTGTIEITD